MEQAEKHVSELDVELSTASYIIQGILETFCCNSSVGADAGKIFLLDCLMATRIYFTIL